MGWFDEQVRQRKESDRELFEDSILQMASAVAGRVGAGVLRDSRIVTKAAIDEILKYFHCKPVEIPPSVTEPEEQLDYALRPCGLGYRYVKLTEDWYRNTFGPLLAFRRSDRRPVVLLPKRYGGYTWRGENGETVTAGRQTAQAFLTDAICFYRPLPQKQLGVSDLLIYMKDCLSLWDYAVFFGLTLLATLAGTLLPRVTRFLSGFVLESGNTAILWSTAVFLICVLISTQLFTASRALALSRIQIKVALPMQAAVMMRLLNLPARFFQGYTAGGLASRAGAVNLLPALLMGSLFSLGATALASLLYLRQIIAYAPALAAPAILTILATVAATLLAGVLKTRVVRECREADAAEAGVSFALISGIQKIKLSGAEKLAFARWARTYAAGAEIEYNPPLFLKIHSAIMTAIPFFGTVAIYLAAARSKVDPSSYLAFSAAFGAMTGAFGAFAQGVNAMAQIEPILEMAEPILRAEPEVAQGREMVTKLSGNIELSGVSFRYGENLPYIFDGLDLKVRSGEYIAIVGKTGCGKSTLIRLLLGFETPEKGAVFYDRKDIKNLDLRSLRRKMGVVTQNGSLFLGDIFSNIAVSAPSLSLDEAWEAAETAGIAEDIRAMPMGMFTVIGEGQGGISGGQKQRLLIARAIAPKPKILIFDEATSALDNKTQKQVSEALDRLNCTRIVIAHRLSTVKNCDRILVLDGGKIIEEGSYQALMEKGGFFAELVERQKL